MFEQHNAIVRLLRDNDPDTVSLLKHQLVEGGPESIGHLRELAAVDDATVSAHAHDILAEIESRQAFEDFSLLCHLFADDGEIEEACWLLARIFLPGVETEHYVRKLDIWGRQLKRLTSSAVSTRERVAVLTNYLANDLGFRGNSEQYYDVHNSLLPSLLDTKLGIPISLAILYMMVAGRAGIKVEGINLPGHFIVRHGDILFDPFHRGKILMQADCEAILRKQKLAFQPMYLEPATSRMILIRVLANLLYIYQDNGDEAQRERIASWLKALERK
jgi:regulator of sirC expression with transglutaminase-like and TPR domain